MTRTPRTLVSRSSPGVQMLVYVAIGLFAVRSPNGLRSTPPFALPGVPTEMWKKDFRLYGSVSAQAIHIVCSNETTLEIENILYIRVLLDFQIILVT